MLHQDNLSKQRKKKKWIKEYEISEGHKLHRVRKLRNKRIEYTTLGAEGTNKCQWEYYFGRFVIGFASLYTVASKLTCIFWLILFSL